MVGTVPTPLGPGMEVVVLLLLLLLVVCAVSSAKHPLCSLPLAVMADHARD